MKKNILLHGATNCDSSNYGDYIYADMIYNYLKKKCYNVNFYQPSEFFKKNLNDYTSNLNFNKKNADLIVYLPGGYFGEGQRPNFKENIIQFLRFMPLGIWGAFNNKKMIVLAVGAGPLSNFFMKYGVKKICNASLLVTTRDYASYKCISNISHNKNLYNSGDLILTYDVKFLKKDTVQIKTINKKRKNRRILIIHYNHNLVALEKFAEAINIFSSKHPEYFYVVTSDSILKSEEENLKLFKSKAKFDFFHFLYDNPYELSSLLKISDLILTSKLHVGVIGALLNKSVISVACHYDKTSRFYSQIDESCRCIKLEDASPNDIELLIEQYHDKNIFISNDLIQKSKLTWDLFDKKLQEVFDER